MKQKRFTKRVVIFCLLLSFSAGIAIAQRGLDYRAAPIYGDVELEAGFRSDPYFVDDDIIEVDGRIDVSDDPSVDDPTVVLVDRTGRVDVRRNQDYCVGYTTSEPTFRLTWKGDARRLRMFFQPRRSDDDTTLIVRAPDGEWYCNDDSFGTYSPTLTFPITGTGYAREGRYDIWVGTYSRDELEGWLVITERNLQPDE